jgi:hypothetical protein
MNYLQALLVLQEDMMEEKIPDYLKIGKAERNHAILVARQLFYPKSTIEAIENAKTIFELDRIMRDARDKKYE